MENVFVNSNKAISMKYSTIFFDLQHKWYKNKKSYSILKIEEAELWADFGPQKCARFGQI